MPTKQTAKSGSATGKPEKVWTDEERAAMQESARERKVAARRGKGDDRAEGEREIQAKIAEMPQADRAMAKRIHELVTTSAPVARAEDLLRDACLREGRQGLCFFQAASKFKVRYSTFGFQPDAALDDGQLWPIAFAVIELTPAVEARLVELVKRAAR